MADLYLDWCSHKAAKYAAKRWHYSECLPASPTAKIGVWEDGAFIGVVTYSKGANNNMASFIGLDPTEAAELTRVALDDHESPVTQIMSISRKLITRRYDGLKAFVSYADPDQNHTGTIYQADNWIYTGRSDDYTAPVINGDRLHPKTAYTKYGTSSVKKLKNRFGSDKVSSEIRPGKLRYVYPLDPDVRDKVKDMRKPYP